MDPMHEADETAELVAKLDPEVEREIGAAYLWPELVALLRLAGWTENLAIATARLKLAIARARLAR